MNDRALIHSFETGRGKRLAVLAAALLAVVIVIWAVAAGFHGHSYRSSASALTRPFDTPTQPNR